MPRSLILLTSVLACLIAATSGIALTSPYGQRELSKAGVGCVAGLKSDHGSIAYFRGDTELLNKQLAALANDSQRFQTVKMILHAGSSSVENPNEAPISIGKDAPRQISVNWSLQESCPFNSLQSGQCKCNKREITLHVWVGGGIRLDDLIVPVDFVVQSAGEIDEFVKRHAKRK